MRCVRLVRGGSLVRPTFATINKLQEDPFHATLTKKILKAEGAAEYMQILEDYVLKTPTQVATNFHLSYLALCIARNSAHGED